MVAGGGGGGGGRTAEANFGAHGARPADNNQRSCNSDKSSRRTRPQGAPPAAWGRVSMSMAEPLPTIPESAVLESAPRWGKPSTTRARKKKPLAKRARDRVLVVLSVCLPQAAFVWPLLNSVCGRRSLCSRHKIYSHVWQPPPMQLLIFFRWLCKEPIPIARQMEGQVRTLAWCSCVYSALFLQKQESSDSVKPLQFKDSYHLTKLFVTLGIYNVAKPDKAGAYRSLPAICRAFSPHMLSQRR